jgi:hypothetical protein
LLICNLLDDFFLAALVAVRLSIPPESIAPASLVTISLAHMVAVRDAENLVGLAVDSDGGFYNLVGSQPFVVEDTFYHSALPSVLPILK